jgi:hypothetical protein
MRSISLLLIVNLAFAICVEQATLHQLHIELEAIVITLAIAKSQCISVAVPAQPITRG